VTAPRPDGPTSVIGHWLFARARNDDGFAERLGMWSDAPEVFFAMMEAVVGVAVRRRFGDPPRATPAEITTVVETVRRVSTAVPPLIVEAVLRHEIGEDMPIDEIESDQLSLARMGIYVIIVNNELRLSDNEVRQVLSATERAAADRGLAPARVA
jgi:hypothetical protein